MSVRCALARRLRQLQAALCTTVAQSITRAISRSLSPSAPSASSAGETAPALPKLSIVSHYAQGPPLTSTSSPRSATATPKEAAHFLEAHPSLHGVLGCLAADRLAQRVKLRRLQTDVVRTSVKLTRAVALASSAEVAPASRSRGMDSSQLQGVVAAATANFVEDVAWCSTVTPHSPQLNPWCLLPVSAEGCYLTLPSSQFVQWCEQQAVRCCAGEGTAPSAEPDVRGGPMRYNDVVHYAGAGGTAATCTATRSFWRATQRLDASLRDDSDEEASVLVWCVLSDAPVFNFMRALTHEAVAAMSYVAQRLYREHVASTESASASAAPPHDIYTALLDDAIQEEVVLPLAKELLHFGSVSSRTLPGDTFTVQLALTSSSGGAIASHPLASSVSDLLTFCRPLDLLYPYADVPLSLLLLSFNEDALRVLQSLLMQEERVVVLGATPQHASACVVSLLALLSPLTWVSPLVPYLPPHLAAVTGLLQTLLKPPFAQQQQQVSSGKPSAAVPPSQRTESSGFLVGSTAAIQPYLILLSSASPGEAGVSVTGYGGSGKRALRVWIADARTGCVGVCPQEPVARFSQADSPASTDPSDGSVATVAASSRSVNAWATRAHVNLRRIVSHNCEGDGSRSATDLYGAVRSSLRAMAKSNVMNAAALDLLPAFSDNLRDQLRRVVSVDKRRLFRHSLEAVAQHTQARLKDLESLAARLARGLRQAIMSTGAGSNMSFESTLNDTLANRSIYSDAEDGNGELTATHTGDDDGDDTTSLRSITEALARSFSKSFAGGPASLTASFAAAPVPQFPAPSLSEVWQVQAGVFDYMVSRFTGAYRRGLSATTLGSGGIGGVGQRRAPAIELSVFLVPGMDQHHALAERVARTHIFKQFECAVLAAEQVGLRRVFSGADPARVGKAQAPRHHGRGEEGHPLLANVRYLALFALLCSRARLHYAELYPDMASVDAVGLVYTALVTRWFANRPGASSSMSVPRAIRLLAGGCNGAEEGAVAAAKHAACSGSGSGHGYGGNGRSRGLRTAYLPAAIACLHTFSVPLFSELPVARQSFAVTSHLEKTSIESSSGEAGGAVSDRRGRRLRHRNRNAQVFLKTCMPPPQRINVPEAGFYSGGRAYGNGLGIESEMFDPIARAGTDPDGRRDKTNISADTQKHDRGLQAMSEASLYICHALPLDIVHRFDAYESLLRPVTPGGAEISPASAGGDALDAGSAAAYLLVGLLFPSCINMWHEVEARAMRAVSEPSLSQATKPPASAASSSASSAQSRLLPPSRAEKPAETSVPQDSRYSVPASAQSTAPQPSAWSAFTSGVPQDYPSVSPVLPDRSPGGDAQQHQASPMHASTAASTTHHRDVWDSWGIQAPSAMVSVQPAPVQGTAAERPQTQVADSGGSGSEGGVWSTGAPLGPPMMLGGMETTPPCISVAFSLTPAADVAPAPRGVMDNLFADTPTHSTAYAAAAGNVSQQQPTAASRSHALDNFF
ncbi:DENN (AEX-3) domain family protein [Leishmania donovani]|uniref:DENN (AEX-3) domain family protein n=1 Tax=Leishmania donovani TaxID=5661 RepID=A0A504X1T9_LEIDO|nr:DENN (AEX-3) domain family protein [Leishmania donovani]